MYYIVSYCVVWCGVVWCGVVWCGVVWCGVVWCGVVWCGVVWWDEVRWGAALCCVLLCGEMWLGEGEVCWGVMKCGEVGEVCCGEDCWGVLQCIADLLTDPTSYLHRPFGDVKKSNKGIVVKNISFLSLCVSFGLCGKTYTGYNHRRISFKIPRSLKIT